MAYFVVNAVRSFSSKQEKELDDKNQHDDKLQQEAAALVELLNHEVVQLVRSPQLLVHQVLIIVYADLDGHHFVESGREHVADKLQCVVGVFRQLGHLEQHGPEAGRSGAHPPAGKHSLAATPEKPVHLIKFTGQHLVVMPELQKLRVGVFD